MRVLVLQHIACEPPGVFEDVLFERGAALHRVELDEGEPLPEAGTFDAIVAMGGPMSATDDDELPWLAAEKRMIGEAVGAGVPFFGVCLGVQLLAASLGARVYPGPEAEVGLLPVTLTPAALSDPVFAGLPHELVTLQWHGDTFDLPDGAVRLAASPAYENQAFRYRRAYGVQFHLEVSREMAAEWADVPAYAASLERTLGAEAAADFLRRIAERADGMRAHGRGLFERWLDHVVVPASPLVGSGRGRTMAKLATAPIEREVAMSEKTWGSEPFWGLGYDWDPDWLLTDRQRELRALLIELCERELRTNAKRSDDELLFPRRNLELLGEHGFLALTVPEEYGGLGENHVAYAMVCETISRYGCASTAMCYVMHIGAVNTIMLRPTPELIDKYIRPLGSGKIGTLSYSDPETGSHFWYPISSGAERQNGGFKVRKKASWTTSAGFADFYVVQTTSPDFSGYDDLSVFVIDGDDVQAQPSLWDALGLRGNQSGPLEVPNVEVPDEQLVGPVGDGAASNDESVDPWFLIGSSSVWNGIAMGAVDIAKRHTTRKRHVDVGLRVADYPTIQDYVGEAVMDTNAARCFVLSVAQAMDGATDNNTRVLAPGEFARANFLHWAWQIKFEAAKNVAHVVDKMLHACGGSGYKRDMELERYLRDAKAGWVMGPTNEVLRQFVGKAVLLGFDSLDYWNQTFNRRAVENEVKKLGPAEKRELAERLVAEAEEAEAKEPAKQA